MALSSMTGYGRSEKAAGLVAAEAEVRSLNARHLSVRCRLPGEWLRLEPRLESLVRGKLRRGSVDVLVRVNVAARSARPRVDRKVLSVYRRALDEIGGGERAELLRLPGVISLDEPSVPARTVERTVVGAVRGALDALLAARAGEGARLQRALLRELATLERERAAIVRRAPAAVRRQQQALRRRLESLLGGRTLDRDDPALLREVAVLADRSDVTEELDRLASHLAGAKALLERDGPVGRELEFLLQEIGREVNTIGSKVGDVGVTDRVIRLKGSVERLREQAANIE